MSSIITAFNYTPSLELMVDAKSYNFPRNSVRSIIIDDNYDKNTMPIIYIKVRISSVLYNRLVLNADKGTISFRLFKYTRDNISSAREIYIEDNFTYIMTSDPNYNEILDQYVANTSTTDTETSETYMEGFIALMSLKCIENNKIFVNDIIKNCNLISAIHKYTNHMTMCIEPLDYIDTIGQHIIPPITTVTDLLKWFDENFTLYKTGYRYFRDFDTTYLLSTKGNAVLSKTNNKFDTVVFSVRDPLDDIGKSNAMELDSGNHAYIIYVDASDTSIKIDRTKNKHYNSIIGVDSMGNTLEEALNIPESPTLSEKPILERTLSDNLDNIYATKNAIESSSIIISIKKSEVDSTIFSPNKEYQIRNYNKNRLFDGKYILSYKKEVILRQDDGYIGGVMLGFRKVPED